MQRTMGALAVAVLLSASLWVFDVSPAHACSCEATSHSTIDAAAAAVMGTVVDLHELDSQSEDLQLVATVDVLTDLKDNVADQIFIDTYADDGGNCGTNWRVGQEIGVVLYEDETGALLGGGCGDLTSELANEYSPPSSPGGLAELVIVGGNGSYRSVAYDAQAQPVAYGFQQGVVAQVDVCPGGQTLVELVRMPETTVQALSIRSLASFEIVGELPLGQQGSALGVNSIQCVVSDGSEVMLLAKEPLERADIFGTYRVTAAGVDLVDEPYLGEPFRPSGEGIWDGVRTSNGVVEGQGWMWYDVPLDAPVQIAPGQPAPAPVQISSGLAPDGRASSAELPAPAGVPEVVPGQPVPTQVPPPPAPPAMAAPLEGAELEELLAAAEDARLEAEFAQVRQVNNGGLSLATVAAIFGGLAAIGLVVLGVLRSDRKRTQT